MCFIVEFSSNAKNYSPPLPLSPPLCLSSPQVLEDNTGVRRVVVTPQSPECYPPSYSPALSPTHHLPPYLTHPHFIPNSHSFYPPVSPGDLSPHQYYQHHLPPIYGEEIIPVYGMSSYVGREESYNKPQPKKMKEQRQLERQNRLNSPPSSLYKSLGSSHNGYSGKSHVPSLGSLGSMGGANSPGGKKPERRQLRSSPRSNEPDTHTQSPQGKHTHTHAHTQISEYSSDVSPSFLLNEREKKMNG
ncbi:unnamed protein product [Oncorhynchus mykiss]|uniref:Uncharacterized protein n=1 Tax=Oncorhynchus mykiss TaxID=8022 RepID=A0A060Z0G1_ONCMY|nr:unnamed protein product [Oncorhynchus mykiss]